MFGYFLVVFVPICLAYHVKDGPLLNYRPTWLKTCRRSDPQMNECLTDLFAEMFPQLARGIEEINVDPFEPLYLDRVSVTKGSGAVTLTGQFTNLTVVGSSNATPTYTELDIAKRKMNFGIYIPLLHIKSKYDLKGKILILPLVGNGDSEVVLKGVDTRIKADISFPIIQGKETMRVDDMTVRFGVTKPKVRLDNLFNGNKVLGLTVNTFINQNGLEIVSELEEPIAESLAQIFKDIINNIFSKIPTDLFLPKEEEVASNAKREVASADN